MMPMLALPEGGEWIVILVIVVLLFGAKKLPELTRNAARAMKEFDKARHGEDEETPQITQPQAATAQQPQAAQTPAAPPAATPPAPTSDPAPQAPGEGSGLGGGGSEGRGQ
ncbi:twin-arginine translocase TatA/TatE family subunit [Kribbella sp. NPDC004875]|uniref:twin-arginine translocase TatA/TatE family subunit n=1 Tax=Kribbella sp. NPDC004875 TaxID=3364107 RepID=UPI0036CD12FD